MLILAPQALKAESNGVFVGVQAGVARVEQSITQIIYSYSTNGYMAGSGSRTLFLPHSSDSFSNTRFGGLLGYKHFISDELGLRAYFVFDGKFQAGSEANDYKVFNYNINLDALYNFYSNKQRHSNIGVFLGASVGGVQYKKGGVIASGTNLALNAGLRTSVGNHSLELFSRFGFLKAQQYHRVPGTDTEPVGSRDGNPGWNYSPSKTATYSNTRLNRIKIEQPYVFGIRYVYSFGF